mgnify:CR=1 FL=1
MEDNVACTNEDFTSGRRAAMLVVTLFVGVAYFVTWCYYNNPRLRSPEAKCGLIVSQTAR